MSDTRRTLRVLAPDTLLPEAMALLSAAIDDEGPAIMICDPASAPELVAVPASTALVILTSGSTGAAHSVALSGAALRASARATHHYLGAEAGQHWSLRLPLTHIAGVMVLIRSIELGTVPRQSDTYADFQSVVPTHLHRALAGDDSLMNALQRARAVIVGGAPLDPELRANAIAHGINVITTYGMTETSGGCVYDGEPLAEVKIRINEDSRIELGGPMLATGYLGDDRADAFHDGWFLTNDLGEIDEQNHLRVLGRADDIVITGGEKVSLTELERIIRTHPSVMDVLCAATPDAEWGVRIKAAVVTTSPLTLAELRDFVGERLGRYAAPRAMVILAEIPLRGIGKPDRGAIASLEPYEEI